MTVHATVWVWKHAEAAGDDLVVMLALSDNCDDSGYGALPAHGLLAERARRTPAEIETILNRLVASGVIDIADNGMFTFPGLEHAARNEALRKQPHAATPLLDEWVYVVGVVGSSIVKIGRTRALQNRLRSMQTASPALLTVRWSTQGGAILEARLHEVFKAKRLAGEWFDFDDEDPVQTVQEAVRETS